MAKAKGEKQKSQTGGDVIADAKQAVESARAKYNPTTLALMAAVCLIVIYILYSASCTFYHNQKADTFVEKTVKSGVDADFDVESEVAKLRKRQENLLMKINMSR